MHFPHETAVPHARQFGLDWQTKSIMAKYQPVRLAFSIFDPADEVDTSLSPVIFLHGIMGSKEEWRDIAQKIANTTNRRAYTLDARNHGDSEWSDYFNFDVNADDVIHFMDSNGISKAVLIGQCMGGMTAIKMSLKWPERIEKLVVEDMIVRKLPKELRAPVLFSVSASRKAIETVPAHLEEKEAKLCICNHIISSIPPEMAKMIEEQPLPNFDKMDFMILRRDVKGIYHFKANLEVIEKAVMDMENETSDPTGVFEGPALFIYGKLSPFSVGSEEEHIKKYFLNAVFEGVEGSGHHIHLDNAEKFTKSVITFLS